MCIFFCEGQTIKYVCLNSFQINVLLPQIETYSYLEQPTSNVSVLTW